MRLTTRRLVLRRARADDLGDLHAVMSLPAVMRYWSTPEHDTPAQTAAYLQSMMDAADSDDFLIEHQGRVIGKAGAWPVPEVGFLLHPGHWGKGLAQEAMGAVIPHLLATHAVPLLTAEVDPRNAASLRLLARLGFHETRRATRTLRWRDEWCDSVYLALNRRGWPPPDPTASAESR